MNIQKNWQSLILLFLIASSLLSCSQTKLPADPDKVVVPMKKLDVEEIIQDSILNRISHFYVKHEFKNNKELDKYLDNFVQQFIKADAKKYSYWLLVFYHESNSTNLKSINEDPRIIDEYSNTNDLFVEYAFSRGRSAGKFFLENGHIVEKGTKIEVKEIK